MNVLIVGGGRIALSHIPQILSNSIVDSISIVEPNFMSRLVMSKAFNCKTYASIDKVNLDEYSCAYVLTPNQTHFPIAQKLIENNVHVFLEKPMTTTYEQSMLLSTLAEKYNVVLQVGYVNRYLDTFRYARKFILDGKLGDITSATNRMVGNVVTSDTKSSWRSSAAGGGCLMDYGPHAIHIGSFVLGEPKQLLNSKVGRIYSEASNDWFEAELLHEGGFVQNIYCNWSDDSVRKAENYLEIKGQEGVLFVSKSVFKLSHGSDVLINLAARDFNTDIDFYLRGEEFSRQTSDFIHNVSVRKSCNSCLEAVGVDKLINQILEVC